jgi:hypothetical protein
MESFIAASAARYALSVFACPPPASETPLAIESVQSPPETPGGGRSLGGSLGGTPTSSVPDIQAWYARAIEVAQRQQQQQQQQSPGSAGGGGAQQTAVGRARGGEGMRQALALYKLAFPDVAAILVGTRRGDPHGGAHPTPSLLCGKADPQVGQRN